MGKKTGPNPTDRGKCGTKRSVLVDGNGIPIALEVGRANDHDITLAGKTISKKKIYRKRNPKRNVQHIHCDKGYDSAKFRKSLKLRGYIPHVARKKRRDRRGRPANKRDLFRWVVERTHSWQNQFRGLKTRWEKKLQNYKSMMYLSFAYIALKQVEVLG